MQTDFRPLLILCFFHVWWNHLWGPLAPQFQANQPWVMSYNGEFGIGELQFHTILARLWIDQEMKEAMGH